MAKAKHVSGFGNKERPSVSLCLGLGPKHVSVWARCRERDMFFVVTCCVLDAM